MAWQEAQAAVPINRACPGDKPATPPAGVAGTHVGRIHWARHLRRQRTRNLFVVLFHMVFKGYHARIGEFSGVDTEHPEQQHQSHRHHQSQNQSRDEYLPQQRVLKLQMHEEGDHAEELDHRQYHQRRDDHTAACSVSGTMIRNSTALSRPGIWPAGRNCLSRRGHPPARGPEETRYPGIFVGRVLFVAHGGPRVRGLRSSGGCLLET